MPGKSRHRKGKYSLQKRRKKGRPSRPAIAAQQPAVTQAQQPASRPSAPAPSTSVTKPAAVQYPYIATELRTIGILAGIMLIILAVLVFILS